MSDRADVSPSTATHEPYSPQRRTALVLTGTGTAGAYHAGVLRALHEAGVKLDIVAGRGVGVIGALFAAVDGAQRLWDDKGFWRAPGVEALYAWRTVPRVIMWSLGISLAIVALPVAAVALGLIVFPIDFVLKMVGIGGASGSRGRVPAGRGERVRAGGAADLAAAARAAGPGRRRPDGARPRLDARCRAWTRRVLVADRRRAALIVGCGGAVLGRDVGSRARRGPS